MDDELESLRAEVRHLFAMNAASYVAITSLVATHPNPQQFHLHLVSALESVLASPRLARWSEEQKTIVRLAVEAFQGVRPADTIDPLSGLNGHGR